MVIDDQMNAEGLKSNFSFCVVNVRILVKNHFAFNAKLDSKPHG